MDEENQDSVKGQSGDSAESSRSPRPALETISVWVVERGEYSGRSVSGVYSTEANANIAAGNDGGVTEYMLDTGISEHRAGLTGYCVVMDKEGNVRDVQPSGHLTSGASFDLGLACFPAPNTPWVYDHITALVWATDDRHAVKITNERRAQMIASGEWDDYELRLNTPSRVVTNTPKAADRHGVEGL